MPEQLESIASQTRPPDELIVCDDGSTDGTVGIVKDFRSRAHFPVRFYVNDVRLGYTKNFEKAIGLCEGDLIFLADQDDVWNQEKLSVLTGLLVASPDIGAVFTDADVVDERLIPRGYGLWEVNGFNAALQKKFSTSKGAFDLLLKGYIVSGMTMGFRASFRDLVLPIPVHWFHDAWISVLIAAVAGIAMFPQPLVRYRQHERQAIGVVNAVGLKKRSGLRDSISQKRNTNSARGFLRLADTCADVQERLKARMPGYPGCSKAVAELEARIRHYLARAAMRNGKGRFRLVMQEALSLNYQRYSSGWKSIAADAFL